jgi:hypothetical protein
MARFLGARCQCGQLAASHRTIRSYRRDGRLTEREAGLVLPRADKPPVRPALHSPSASVSRRAPGPRHQGSVLGWPPELAAQRQPDPSPPVRWIPNQWLGLRSSSNARLTLLPNHPGRAGSYGLSPWEHGRRPPAQFSCSLLSSQNATSTGLNYSPGQSRSRPNTTRVRTGRRRKLIEQLSFRIAIRATTLSERGRFRAI